jgi:hypothetical protein
MYSFFLLADAVLFSGREHVFMSSYWLAQFYSVDDSIYSFLPIGWRSFIQWRRTCIPFFLMASDYYSMKKSAKSPRFG